jgi:hypothetical protein
MRYESAVVDRSHHRNNACNLAHAGDAPCIHAQLDASAADAKKDSGAQLRASERASSAACLPIDTLRRRTTPDENLSEENVQAMRTSRRHAIKLGMSATVSLVTVEGLLGHVVHAAEKPSPFADDGGFLRRDLFESCRGQLMTVRRSPRSISLQLMRVDDVPTARQTGAVGDENSFIVLFRGPRSPKLAQGTYRVESSALGTFPLFLVPGWTYASGTAYTATFNRLP